MSYFDADFAAANDAMLEAFGDLIIYHRGRQAIPLQAIRGGNRQQTAVRVREMAQDELHYETWDLRVADLAGLGEPDETGDWIECGAYKAGVLRVEGDQDWDFITPDRIWARIRTEPIA